MEVINHNSGSPPQQAQEQPLPHSSLTASATSALVPPLPQQPLQSPAAHTFQATSPSPLAPVLTSSPPPLLQPISLQALQLSARSPSAPTSQSRTEEQEQVHSLTEASSLDQAQAPSPPWQYLAMVLSSSVMVPPHPSHSPLSPHQPVISSMKQEASKQMSQDTPTVSTDSLQE